MKIYRSTPLGRIRLPFCLALIVLLSPGSWVRAEASGEVPRLLLRPALEPVSTGGLEALDHGLARLSAHRRLLIIAAHPDDEDTTLLTLVSRGLGGEAAYLSLSRGEGGQNLIGPELGVGLGLIRARELLAARERDGARQFFTRAYDFGYTRSLEETFERWPKEVLLADAVRAILTFKPQVVVAIFPPDARAGHGQHQASAVVAEEAIRLAAAGGQQADPWRVEAFYRSAWFNRAGATLELPLGGIQPMSGRSILQLALDSRSQHRSQDMGLEQPLGDASSRLQWVSGAGEESTSASGIGPFVGIDTRLEALAAGLPREPWGPGDCASRTGMEGCLRRVARLATEARAGLSPTRPHSAVPALVEIVQILQQARRGLDADGQGPGPVRARHVRDILAEKLQIASESLATAAQVFVDAVTDRETMVPGESFLVRSQFWNAGEGEPKTLRVHLESPVGWRQVAIDPAEPLAGRFATRLSDERLLTVEIPATAKPTVPYFLERPRQGDLYDWSTTPLQTWTQPFAPPPLTAVFSFDLGGAPVELRREVVYRYRDQALGEVRRPLRAVPAVELEVSPSLIVQPLDRQGPLTLEIRLTSNQSGPVSGRLEMSAAEAWPTADLPSFELAGRGDRQTFEVEIDLPPEFGRSQSHLHFSAVSEEGERFSQAFPVIDYEHIRPTPMPTSARATVVGLELRFPHLSRLGYVRGAADRVPEMLLSLGLPLEILDAEALAAGDFAAYDAIVIGSRAYETDSDLRAANSRLLDYVRAGGLMIVQYQQYQFVRGGFAPFPFDISRPHDRITDEAAPWRLLDPEHPVFNHPNVIGPEDWLGWVQERGLYFAGTWDAAYGPLLALKDPGGEEQKGGLLVADLGQGRYVYTGLAFFRQLPAGVPGPYRLFANLLALGRGE